MAFTQKQKNNKLDFLLILILIIIGLFFRLWKLKNFQYWSDDEQLLFSIVRHMIVDKHPSLVTPNVALGIGLGPIFHYLLIPWFWLIRLDPVKILPLGNVFFLLNVILIYLTGKLIAGKKVGFIAGLLYASSFMSSLFDRRLWALSPNISLILLGIISLIQLVNGKSKYFLFLVIPAAFALNSDPSLGVIVLASLSTLAIFKPKITRKHLFLGLSLLVLLLLPLFIFEIRHQGQNLKSFSQTIVDNRQNKNEVQTNQIPFLSSQVENFSRFFYAQASQAADAYFCYCRLDDHLSFPLVLGTCLTLILFVLFAFKEKNKSFFVLLLTLVSYLIGIFLYKNYFRGHTSFFYSMTISPVLFLIAAVVIAKIKYLPFILLPFMFLVNLYTLTHSGFKYPLTEKVKLVQEIISKLPDKNNFSLYYSGDILSAGGGWTALFLAQNAIPAKGSLSLYWGHVYQSYNLYPVVFSQKEPGTVVVISGKSFKIYNNKNNKFRPEIDLEKLFQPEYFQ